MREIANPLKLSKGWASTILSQHLSIRKRSVWSRFTYFFTRNNKVLKTFRWNKKHIFMRWVKHGIIIALSSEIDSMRGVYLGQKNARSILQSNTVSQQVCNGCLKKKSVPSQAYNYFSFPFFFFILFDFHYIYYFSISVSI